MKHLFAFHNGREGRVRSGIVLNYASLLASLLAVKNKAYVQLAREPGIRHTHYSSVNNTGNVMESLCWLACVCVLAC